MKDKNMIRNSGMSCFVSIDDLSDTSMVTVVVVGGWKNNN
jgi:hypothetical protein